MTVTCRSCGRPLRAAASIARRRGRACHARALEEALRRAAAGYTRDQLARALDLIAGGGLIPHTRPGAYLAVSSDGSAVYLVDTRRCSCPAGVHEIRCYHRLAVALTEAWKAAHLLPQQRKAAA